MSVAAQPRKGLRAWLAGRDPATAADLLAAHLREQPEANRAEAWVAVQSLAADRPEVLRGAATRLMAEPAHRNQAILALVRMYNRRQDWPALRDVLLAHADNPPVEARDWPLALLRLGLLAPDLVDPAAWNSLLAEQPPLAQTAYAVQRAVVAGSRPPVAALHAKLDRAMQKAVADGLPEVLLRLRDARDVAVVGNGSGLAGARAAGTIEAHDFVIRMNYPVLTGHEGDTGRRTDLMLFAEPKRRILPSLIAREAGYDALPAFGVRGFGFRSTAVEGPPRMPGELARLIGMLSYAHPTTGFFAILLAGVLFRRPITLFGFDFFAPGRPGHYFGPTNAAPQHELTYERWYTDKVLPLLCPQMKRG